MSTKWDQDNTLDVESLERKVHERQQQNNDRVLLLEFPDAELNETVVKEFSPGIESVEFNTPFTSRCCYIKLKENAKIDDVCREISQTPFGCTGNINVETINSILNPCILEIDNVPKSMSIESLEKYLSTSNNITIKCDPKKIFYNALICYDDVEEAFKAFKVISNLSIDCYKLNVKFHRQNSINRKEIPSENQNNTNKCSNRMNTNRKEEKITMDTVREEENVLEKTEMMAFRPVVIKQEKEHENEGNCDDNEIPSFIVPIGIKFEENQNDDTVDNIKTENLNSKNELEQEDDVTMVSLTPILSDTNVNYWENYRQKELNYEEDKKPVTTSPLVLNTSNSAKTPSEVTLASKTFKRYSICLNGNSKSIGNFRDSYCRKEKSDKSQVSPEPKKKVYRDELDELFEKMNSDDEEDLLFKLQ